MGPVWVPTRAFNDYWPALGGILAIECVLASPQSGYRPHRGEQVRLLVPTARKVLVSTIIRIVRSFDRSLRYNVGSYVCRIIRNMKIVCWTSNLVPRCPLDSDAAPICY